MNKTWVNGPVLILVISVTMATAFGGSVQTDATRIRVACVGDSITEGTVLPGKETNSYPAVLGRLLGDRYDVRNYGRSGTTIVAGPNANPYHTSDSFRQALAFSPDIVIIKLGTNDTKTNIWPNLKATFPERYRFLVESFRWTLARRPFIIACLPAPVYGEGHFSINERYRKEVVEAIRGAATEEKILVIDPVPILLNHPEWFPDTVHPDIEGTAALAEFIAGKIRPLKIAEANGK